MMDPSKYRGDIFSHLLSSLEAESPRHVPGVQTVRCIGLNTCKQVCMVSSFPVHDSMSTCTHHSIGDDPSSSNVAFALSNSDFS